MSSGRPTYLLVDGENIDATFGISILGRRPNPDERPRWDRVREFAQTLWRQPVTALFFLNASSGQMPGSFVQALLAMDYRPLPLSGALDEKVVDIGIQRTMAAIADRPGDVLLASHDADFAEGLEQLLGGGRRVGVLGFREYLSTQISTLEDRGLSFYDLEDDVKAFNAVLPRVRIIPIDSFDPTRFL